MTNGRAMIDIVKIEAEIAKLNAETVKLQAETSKLHREVWYYPMVSTAVFFGAVLAVSKLVLS